MKKKRRIGIILQVAILFAIGAVVTGILTYFTQYGLSIDSVQRQMEGIGGEVADEVMMAVKEYPAYEWLLEYWHAHAREMDVEYDVAFDAGTRTEEKCGVFSQRHPDLQLKYAALADIEALPAEDQKLYAEIVYSWVTTRVNQIKQAFRIDYLFCVTSDESYSSQFFLFSGADPGAVRGMNYEEVYLLGTEISITENESLREAMRSARQHASHWADAGNYVDYYAFLGEVNGQGVFVGMTYNLSGIWKTVNQRTWQETAFTVALQILLSLLCLALLYLYVLRPLMKVKKNIGLYTETKDSATVTENLSRVHFRNEIGQLSEDFVSMTKEIDDYVNRIEAITAEKERMGVELNLAARIQEGALPSRFPPFPDRTDFDIYAVMDPAKEVGGDFYDFFLLDEDHLGLVIADVSGKGIPASLFMMVSMILIHNTALSERSPAKVLEKVNNQICPNNREEMFVTVWLGVLELSTGKLTAASAGHEYPAIKEPDGHFEILEDQHGFVIGGMAGIKYKEYEIQMKPGSKLFVYTDGVPEASNEKQELFGLDRLVRALRRGEDGAPEEILATVNRDVQMFVGDAPQFDDLTMLCVTYQGKSE